MPLLRDKALETLWAAPFVTGPQVPVSFKVAAPRPGKTGGLHFPAATHRARYACRIGTATGS